MPQPTPPIPPNLLRDRHPLGETAVRPISFSGADVHATAFIHPEDMNPTAGLNVKSYVRLGELTTLTASSTRGVCPIRVLGEHWVRDYVRGSRTFAGSLVFSLLDKDVFAELYSMDKRDVPGPYKMFVDQLPPLTIGLSAINELGHEASMFLYGVTLTNWGMALSIDDLFIETTYNYVAKWATPFMPGSMLTNLKRLRQTIVEPGVRKASDFYIPKKEV